jgi:midasin (ATPase involved in ribosome maturation)
VAAKDNVGRLFINKQLTSAFSLRFDFDMAPQTLEAWDDEPEGLPEEYHDWIAWEALANLARYDKDQILLTYAQSMSDVYKRRAERNLLPPITWQPSIYNKWW